MLRAAVRALGAGAMFSLGGATHGAEATGAVAFAPVREARSVGFQRLAVPYSVNGPIEIGIWYPTTAPATITPLGLFTQTVATDGAIDGARLPVVLISHGTGGSLASHYDTALELARAGFIAVALTHPGDNARDQSAAGNNINLLERPRHVTRVLDFITREWIWRDHADSTRVGIFGASLGAFTAVVAAGGMPDMARVAAHCTRTPDAAECRFVRERHGDQLTAPPPARGEWRADPRIRAIVVAAPALGFVFTDAGLRSVTVPVQLWRAANDSDAPNATNSDALAAGLPRKPEMHTVPLAGHFVFLAPCSEALAAAAPAICRDPAAVDRRAVHETFNTEVVRFLRANLS